MIYGDAAIKERMKKSIQEGGVVDKNMRAFKDTRTFNFKTTMKANFGIKFKQGEDHTDDGPLYG